MATSYTNPGGSGNRTSTITITATGSVSGSPTILINGNTADTGFFFMGVSGLALQFQFTTKKVIDEAKFYQSHNFSHGTWKWQGSNDGSAWTDIGSTFTLGVGTTQTLTTLAGNTTAYFYYKLLQTAGTGNPNPWLYEMEFKIDEEAVVVSAETVSTFISRPGSVFITG